jgi:predicted transcriptional regulator
MNEIKTPWQVTSQLLSIMVERGFIECIGVKKNERFLRKYSITAKGNQLYESLMLSQGIIEYNPQKEMAGIIAGE